MAKKKDWTGERLETYIYADVAVEHLHRYAIASELVAGKIVADIASGEGYGTAILAQSAAHVTGIDIDPQSVSAASGKYKSNNLIFSQGSADNMPLEDASVDVLVSFETIEHHDKHEEMFLEIRRVLRPGGLLIMSSPNKKYYSDLPQKSNPFHVKELYVEEFDSLCRKHFSHVGLYAQNCINGNSIIDTVTTGGFDAIKVFTGDFTAVVRRDFYPMYNLALASDQAIPVLGASIFDGARISERIKNEQIADIRASATYKAGRLLVGPLSWTKRFIPK